MGLIDSHAHLTFPQLCGRIDEVLARCDEVGVERIITIGLNLDDSKSAVTLSERYAPRVYATAGVHPHEAGKATDADLSAIARLWDEARVVGVGEIGLDYHYDFAGQSVQRSVF
jgi:TatD DNase family protein